MRAKAKAKFTKIEAESSKEKAEEEAYALGVAETQATLRAQVPGVCRLYCSHIWNEALKEARLEVSSDLWKVENIYYPLTIQETAPSSSEVEVAPEEAEAARPKAALTITALDEPAQESELSRVTETNEGLNPKAPRKTAESIADTQAPHAKESTLPIEPFQTIPPSKGFKDLETISTQLSKEGIKINLKK